MTFEELKNAIEKSGRNYDLGMIEKAYLFAEKRHEGQLRRSGEPYIIHPIAVASYLVDLGLDSECICAALLHDVVEDTNTSLDEIRAAFGEEVTELVNGVTKLGKIPFSSVEEEQAENLRKMLLAMSKDIRVMIIKLNDRLHNMRTMDYMAEQKRRDKSRETMEVYAPIAHRLGMEGLKDELQDLSLKYLDPRAFNEITEILEDLQEKNGQFIEKLTQEVGERLRENGLEHVEIQARVKSVYGIYRKLYEQNRSIEEIYDIYAIRILVDTVSECYTALGVVHDMYTPIPKRFKDYISTPKSNMYQSLHTTVIGENETPFEIQIRTYEMHREAEYGVAAHWKYKEGVSESSESFDEKLEWVRQLLESQKESQDATDLLRSIKSDLLPEEVFVLTPKGDVIDLPAGATVIDFAYAIHTAVGNRMIGAKVNGRIVPINYQVNSSEIVEVILGPKDKGPSRDWLSIAQTSGARAKIRGWFKRERREENIEEGKNILEKELRREMIRIPADKYDDFLDELVRRQRLNTKDELFAEIGYGGIPINRIIPKAREEYEKIKKAEEPLSAAVASFQEAPITRTKSVDGVIIEGMDNCLIRFSRCCNPLPGDEIVGFITRGKGVSIHKASCKNVINTMNSEDGRARMVAARWDDTIEEQFKADLIIYCLDRTGMIADVSGKLSSLHIPIYSMNTSPESDRQHAIKLSIGVSGKEHLYSTLDKLRKIKGVLSVERIGAES